MTKLLLIESPGKLKKLSQILGAGWVVKASMGHVRELANQGEDALGFELNGNTVDCHYIPRNPKAKQVLASLRQAAKQADTVYIATDPDREGETIGWHLQQALGLKQPQRVVYSEIPPAAVRAAIAHPRQLDQALIAAGRARDCLDKLVGYKGSRHVVWPLNNGAKSMGRVQSATLHLLCLRERDIQAFTPQPYWSVSVSYQEGFKAFYRRQSSEPKPGKAATSPEKSSPKNQPAAEKAIEKVPESDRVTSQVEADRLVEIARACPHQVVSITGKTTQQSPPPPFITSTVQQAAGAKLRFSPEHTMKVAQALYEAGLITYMRTDSVELAAPFKTAVQTYLQTHDPDNVPQRVVRHRAAKGAQVAHEAIRPTEVTQTPTLLDKTLPADQGKLYDLIWRRAVASQCCPARLRKTRIVTQSGEVFWEARGQLVEFAGYTRYWNNLSADTQLPALNKNQPLTLGQAAAEAKQTQPPLRYSEPKLVQLMERQGIGRPSTYAPTIKTLRQRQYVELIKGKLQPTALGLDLDAALETLLPYLIQPEFTAQMEAALDEIASGQQNWETYLTQWHRDYFGPALCTAQAKISSLPARTGASISPSPSIAATLTPTASATATAANPLSPGQTSKVACPKCQQLMRKVPSRSKKMKAKHFLKCEVPGCGAVMFWNAAKKCHELPYAQRPADPQAFTDHLCPKCGAWLERYGYVKDGQQKEMLRCSVVAHRRGKCKDVAYFKGREGFWSPKLGHLVIQGPKPENR